MSVYLHLHPSWASLMQEKKLLMHEKGLYRSEFQIPETTVRNVMKGHTVLFNYCGPVSTNDLVIQTVRTNDILKRINLVFLRLGMTFENIYLNKKRVPFLALDEWLHA